MNLMKKLNMDGYRFLATLMVVAIHVYPFSSFSEDIDYMVTRVLFRIAVPIFLMITGYYILPKALHNKNTIKSYTRKIVKLYFISTLIFLPINIYNGYFQPFDILSILKDFFLNGTFYHLWYFPSLLLGLWISYFLLKKLKMKRTGIIVLILYMIGIFGDNYFGMIKNIGVLKQFYNIIFCISDYTRNGLFYTPIFLYMGYLVSSKRMKIENQKNFIFIILNLILLIIEGALLYVNKIPRHSSMYVFLIPLSYLIFNFIIHNSNTSNKDLRTISSWIYILHPFFIVILHFISNKIPLSLLNNSLVNYSLVLLLTIGFIFIIRKGKEVVIEWNKKC